MSPPHENSHAGSAALERLRRIAEAVQGAEDGAWLVTALNIYEAHAAAGARFDETVRLAPGPGQKPWDTVGEFAGLAESGHLTGGRFASWTLPGGPKPA